MPGRSATFAYSRARGAAVLAAGAGRVGFMFLYFSSIFPFLCPVFWETAVHD